jgi:hypothetical protein
MSRKIVKGLWIPPELAEEFDREVQRLASVMPERLETGVVGAAALIAFIRLPSDKEKLEAIKAARSCVVDRAIRNLAAPGIGSAEEADRIVDDASTRPADPQAGREIHPRKKANQPAQCLYLVVTLRAFVLHVTSPVRRPPQVILCKSAERLVAWPDRLAVPRAAPQVRRTRRG